MPHTSAQPPMPSPPCPAPYTLRARVKSGAGQPKRLSESTTLLQQLSPHPEQSTRMLPMCGSPGLATILGAKGLLF